MSEFKSLVLLQLKDKLNFSSLNSLKKKIFRVLFWVIKLALITGSVYLGFYVLSVLRLFSLLPGIPLELFTIIFSVMITLSVFVVTGGLTGSLYFAKDNFVLLSLPVSKVQVFLSKLVVYFIYEFIRNLTFLMPVIIAYFIINKCALFYYLWLIPILIIYTGLVLSLSALLSIPILFVVNYLKNKQWLKVALLIGIIACVVFVITKLILLIPENFDIRASWGSLFWDIQQFMKNFSERTWIFRIILVSLIGTRYGVSNRLFAVKQWQSLGVLILLMVFIGLITYLLVRPMYFKMASSGFEHKKKEGVSRIVSHQRHSAYFAIVKKEFLLTYRDSGRFYPLIIISLTLPLSILLLNKIYGAMDTRLAGNNMAVAFNVLIILLIALSSSVFVSKSISTEGASSYINKIAPQSYLTMLSAKLIINAIIYSFSILVSAIIFGVFSDIGGINIAVMFLMLEGVYIAHLLFSAELDVMNPQILEYSTTGTHVNNKNENKSSMVAIFLSVIFAFLTFFLISENAINVWLKLMFVAIGYLIIRVYLYVSKVQLFYKER